MKYIFSIPILETEIDLKKIKVSDAEFQPTWECGILTTFRSGLKVSSSTWRYLHKIINPFLDSLGDPYREITFTGLWRNKYDPKSFQGSHIHPKCQWSFIIYETVPSKTAFLNPYLALLQNQWTDHSKACPLDYRPRLQPGSMIVFPSFITHEVLPGNDGTTLAGNIEVDYI
jgi:hypothetical protein